jgi:hypothetical protein
VDVCGAADVSKVRATFFFRNEKYGERYKNIRLDETER